MNLVATLNVVDLAKYQDPNSLDWQGMVNAGVKAVIIQLSHGTVYEDYAREHIAKAQSVGLIVHGYHYYQGETGEVDFSISNAISLGLPKSSYMFLDFEDTSISGDWSSQANDFFTAWKQAGWKAGLYTGGSLYKSKFNNDSLVNSGIYRWIAAYGTNDGTAQSGYEPANYDAWQYTSSGGIGSYTGALDKSYDKTGKLITIGSTPTKLDPYEPVTPTAGAYVGTGIDTTGLGGGRAYGYSTDGNSFYSALTPFGFVFREVDADRMWTLIKPKIPTIQGVKGDTGLSAYQLAINNGYTGTEAEWLASLKGADGDPGKDSSSIIVDTSNDNRPPSWYFTNYPQKIAEEFKSGTKIGLTGSDYVELETRTAWNDSSRGWPVQIAHFLNGTEPIVYIRKGISSTDWSAWRQITLW